MRAAPGDRRVAEAVGYEALGYADGIANDDQGDSYADGDGDGDGHHCHADTDAHDGDTYVNSDADTNPVSDLVSRRYGG